MLISLLPSYLELFDRIPLNYLRLDIYKKIGKFLINFLQFIINYKILNVFFELLNYKSAGYFGRALNFDFMQ